MDPLGVTKSHDPCSRAFELRVQLWVHDHGEPKVNLFHNIRIIQGLYYPKRLKVTYSTTRLRSVLAFMPCCYVLQGPK